MLSGFPAAQGSVSASQENFLTLKGLCCRGAAFTLIPLFKDAPKALTEAGIETSLSRSHNGNLYRYDRQPHKPQYSRHISDYTVSI